MSNKDNMETVEAKAGKCCGCGCNQHSPGGAAERFTMRVVCCWHSSSNKCCVMEKALLHLGET